MKVYTIEITIREGSDEYWEEITADGNTGCDQVLEDVKNCLIGENWQDFDVELIKYSSNK